MSETVDMWHVYAAVALKRALSEANSIYSRIYGQGREHQEYQITVHVVCSVIVQVRASEDGKRERAYHFPGPNYNEGSPEEICLGGT
jgi:hypothetical protein